MVEGDGEVIDVVCGSLCYLSLVIIVYDRDNCFIVTASDTTYRINIKFREKMTTEGY